MSQDAAVELLALMQNGRHEEQLTHLATMKQSIKREIIETSAVPPLFKALEIGLPHPNTQISSQSLTLAHGALRRLNIQDQSLLRPVLGLILPHFITKLGDPNEKVADLSRDCLAVAWKSSGADVERIVKESGYRHKNWLVRKHAIGWTLKMSRDKPTGFVSRPFVGFLIACLEDSREEIQETAKQALIEICEPLPPHARADVRRELYMQKVRKPTVDMLLAALNIADGPDLAIGRTVQPVEEPRPKRTLQPSSHYEGSIAGSLASTFIGSVPGSELETIEAAYIGSARDLEHDLQAMLPFFEGRESEKNWLNRERSIGKMRSLLRGNAAKDHANVFLAGIKSLLDGIIKGMTSLRTSLCLASLQLVKDMCVIMGSGIDSLVEQLLVTLVKLTGLTKKIAAQAANVTACVMLSTVSYHARLLTHILQAAGDKNVAPRQYAANWLKVLLEAHLEVKSQIEHSGMDHIDKILRKGLADANPAVRDAMRGTYWSFAAVWPDKASSMLSTFDAGTRKGIEKAREATGPPQQATTSKPSDISRLLTHSRNGSAAAGRPMTKTTQVLDRPTKPAPAPAPVVVDENLRAAAPVREQRPTGLSSGPQRLGMSAAARSNPGLQPPRKPLAKPEDPLRTSVRSNTSAGQHTNGSSLSASHASPLKRDVPPSAMKKKPVTIVEQLESEQWRTRVEGVVTLACLLANKEPPNSDGTKIVLPSNETLAPILRKLMADQQAEVVDHLMAPEVISEIAKIIDWDAILPRVLYMAETDDSDRGHDVQKDCLPAVKRMFSDHEAVQHCLETLAVLKVSGHSVKVAKPAFRFTPAQKRPIIKAVLLWLTEVIERHHEAVARGEPGNAAFVEPTEYKLVMNRIMSMMTNVQPTSMNYGPLAACLKALRRADEAIFDKNLSTFERPVTNALKRAWGEKAIEEEASLEEPVADVQQVLGSHPLLVAEPVSKRIVSGATDITSTPDKSATSQAEGFVAESPQFGKAGLDSPQASEGLVHIMPPKTPKNFRNALALLEDSPMSSPDVLQARNEDPNGVSKQHKKFHGEDRWYRAQMRKQAAGTPLPASFQAKQALLASLTDSLRQGTLDFAAFRRFGKLIQDEPSDEGEAPAGQAPDLWEAGTAFDLVISSITHALQRPESTAEYKAHCITLLRSLIRAQPRYFTKHYYTILEALLSLASNTDGNHGLVVGVEESVLEIVDELEPERGTEMMLQYLWTFIEGDPSSWHQRRLASLQVSLVCLARLIVQLPMDLFRRFAVTIADLVFKAFNDKFKAPDVEVAELRRRAVNVCLSAHTVVGDTRQTMAMFHRLKPAHQNLLTYYFANKERDAMRI